MEILKSEPGQEKIPLGQVLLDDVYLLIALGLGIPAFSYIVWALFDLSKVPAMQGMR